MATDGGLTVLDDNTEPTDVWFQMYGANINLDGDGNITSVVDGLLTLEFYYAMCEEQGLPRPGVLVEP